MHKTPIVTALITMYARYRLVDELNRDADHHITRLNNTALGMAIATCAGLSVVANFQVIDDTAISSLV